MNWSKQQLLYLEKGEKMCRESAKSQYANERKKGRVKNIDEKKQQVQNTEVREWGKQKWNKNKESCVFKLRYEVLIIANNCKQKRIKEKLTKTK